MDAVTLALMRYSASKAGGGTETVTGNAPITLSDASAKPIVSLTQTGLCTQAGADIYCNNGILTASPNLMNASAANTALGYYIEKATGQVRHVSAGTNFMFDSYMPVIGGESYVAYGRTRDGGVISAYNRIAWYDSNQDWISGGDYTQNTVTVNTAPNNAAYARFSCNPSGTTTTAVTQDMVDSYYWVFQKGTEEPSEVHPYGEIYVVGTPEVLTVSGNIVEFNETRIDNTTWAAADKSHGFEVRADVYNKHVGNSLFSNANAYGAFVPCKLGQSISINFFDYAPYYGRCYYCEVTADGKCNTEPVKYSSNTALTQQTFTLTQADSIGFVIEWYISAEERNYTKENYAVCYGTTPLSAYQPYTPIQTVNDVPMLLSVGDYKDEGEIISGAVTRACGIKILTGEESVNTSNACFTVAVSDKLVSKTALLCSHFQYSSKTSSQTEDQTIISFSSTNIGFRYDSCADKTAFAAWLAEQYAAGTPVIVVYPLAEAATESVAGQALHTVAGTNTVSVTAEVSPIALEAVYKSGSGSGSSSTWLLQCLLRTSQRKGRP